MTKKKTRNINAVMVFVIDENCNILLLKRIDNDLWEPVKGGMHKKETWLDGAKRELNEETGLFPSKGPFLVDIVEDFFISEDKTEVVVNGHVSYCLVKGIKPEIKLNNNENDIDHKDSKWINIDIAIKEKIFPEIANKMLLKVIKKSR